MKQKNRFMCIVILSLAIASLITGCSSGPKLGEETPLQSLLNQLPAVPVAGKTLKFEFGGDTWIAKLDGQDYLAGTFTSEDNDEGSVLTLNQTHLYSTEQKPGIGGDIGWVKTPGPEIALDYKKGPPESLSVK